MILRPLKLDLQNSVIEGTENSWREERQRTNVKEHINPTTNPLKDSNTVDAIIRCKDHFISLKLYFITLFAFTINEHLKIWRLKKSSCKVIWCLKTWVVWTTSTVMTLYYNLCQYSHVLQCEPSWSCSLSRVIPTLQGLDILLPPAHTCYQWTVARRTPPSFTHTEMENI